MEDTIEKFTHLLANLSLSDNKQQVLESVKPALSGLSRHELTNLLTHPNINLVSIFDCLNSPNEAQVEAGCLVLARLLGAMDPALVLDRYGDLMLVGLNYSSEKVVLLVLSQLARCALDDDVASVLIKRGLLSPCLAKLKGELGVAKEVISLVVNLAETSPGLSAICGGNTDNMSGLNIEVLTPACQQLVQMTQDNSIIQLRVLELVVKIAVLSEERLKAVRNTGLLQQLVNLAMDTNDCLAQLAGVELLTLLALPPHGSVWLESTGVLTGMARQLEEAPNNPLASVLLPGLVKFFGNLAHSRPRHILVKFPSLVTSLTCMTDSDDTTAQSVAFETIGFIGVSLEGKLALSEIGNRMTNCIDKLEQLITDSPTEVRIRSMNAFASLIKLDKENQTPDMLSLTESWYRRLPSVTNIIVNIVKQPFLDLRLASYQLLLVLARQPWGRKIILRQPGFIEHLLDRNGEQDKVGREEKYTVLETIVDSGEAGDVVGEAVDQQLRLYVRLGPHFIQVQSQVDTEGME